MSLFPSILSQLVTTNSLAHISHCAPLFLYIRCAGVGSAQTQDHTCQKLILLLIYLLLYNFSFLPFPFFPPFSPPLLPLPSPPLHPPSASLHQPTTTPNQSLTTQLILVLSFWDYKYRPPLSNCFMISFLLKIFWLYYWVYILRLYYWGMLTFNYTNRLSVNSYEINSYSKHRFLDKIKYLIGT